MADTIVVSESDRAKESSMPELENAMEDLMHAMANKDVKAMAEAFSAAAQLCEMYESEGTEV